MAWNNLFLLQRSYLLADTMLSEMDEMPTIKLGDYTLQMELEDLKPHVAEIARKELRETPDVKKQAVVELRDLLKEEKNLHVPLDNDIWLIKRYYEFKVKHADMYDGLLPSRERNIFQQNILTVQPNRDQLGRRILIIELG
ncbi:hypothetical protein NQ315_005897, partial [Exocentrus adspersus]